MSSIQGYGQGGNWQVSETQQKPQTSKAGQGLKDNLVSLGGLRMQTVYPNAPGHPGLVPPEKNPNQTNPQHQQKESGPDLKDLLMQAVADKLSAYIENQSPPLQEEQVNQILFHLITGEPIPDDTFIQRAADAIGPEIIEELANAFPEIGEQAKGLANTGRSFTSRSSESLSDLQAFVNTLSDSDPEKARLQQFINAAKGQEAEINKLLGQLQNATTREQIAEYSQKLEQATSQYNDFINGGKNLSNDPNTGAVLGKFKSDVNPATKMFSGSLADSQSINDAARGSWQQAVNSSIAEPFAAMLGKSFNQAFEEALSQLSSEKGLTSEQTAQLRFAYAAYSHDKAAFEKLPQEIKDLVNQVFAQAMGAMSPKWGLPSSYVPPMPDSAYAQLTVNTEHAYEQAFTEILNGEDLSQLAKQLGLNLDGTKALLEFLHNEPEVIAQILNELGEQMLNESPQLKKMLGIGDKATFKAVLAKLDEMQQKAASSVRSSFGLPADHQIKPGTTNYEAKLNGHVLMKFNENLKNREPPLTQEEIGNVLAAISDPLNPNITAETKALIKEIYNQSVSEVKAQFNLPVGWRPDVSLLSSITRMSPAVRLAYGGIEQIDSSLKLLAKHVEGMPDGPARALLLNVLKLISDALADLKDQIAQLQILDAQLQSKISKANEDAALQKLDLQKKKLDEINEKKAKLAPLKSFMKIFGPTMKIFMAVMLTLIAGPFLGPAILAISVLDVTREAENKQPIMAQMVKDIIESLPKPDGVVLASFVMVGMSVALVAYGFGGGALFAMEAFFDSGIVTEISMTAGAKKTTAEWINTGLQIAAQIAVMVVTMVLTMGASGVQLIGEAAQTAAETTASILNKIADMIMRFLEMVGDKLGKVGKVLEKVAAQVKELALQFAAKAKELSGILNSLKGAQKTLKSAKALGNADKIAEAKAAVGKIQGELNKSMKLLNRIYKMSHNIELALGVSADGVRTAQSIYQGQIAQIRSKFDAEIEELAAMIKILQKVLNSIFKALEGQADWMVDVANLQSKLWSDRSQTATVVAEANA